MSGEDGNDSRRGREVDVDEVLTGTGFDPDKHVLTRRQAEVYVLRERGFRQADIAEILGTSRANVASVEASARENIENARNTVTFADVLAAPIHVEIEADTDLYDVPQRIFDTCDEAGVDVKHTAPELMEIVQEAAGDAVRGRQVVSRIAVGVSTDGDVRVMKQ